MTAILHFLITQHCAGCINTGVGRPGAGLQPTAETSPLTNTWWQRSAWKHKSRAEKQLPGMRFYPFTLPKMLGTHLGGGFGGSRAQVRQPVGYRSADPQPIPP